MNNDTINTVRRLSFENWIWGAFIVAAVMDIYGDEITKKGIIFHDKVFEQKGYQSFLRAIIVSIAIYSYFLYRNYNDYKKHPTKNYEVRLMGSLFLLLGALCLLYFQLNTKQIINSASNI